MKKREWGILVVDDELIVRESLTKWFREDGFTVDAVGDASAALQKIQRERWDLVLVDIRMPGMDGIELLQHIKQFDKSIVVIIITAFASVDSAVRALKLGAYDYVMKPIDPDYLNHIVVNALEQQLLLQENRRLKEAVSTMSRTAEIVGDSPEIQKVLEQVKTVSATETPVLLKGESGTGKELVARTIHFSGARRYAPFVTVNSLASSETALASELFGREPETLAGAQFRSRGRIELADGGTLFVDEIENMDLMNQADLVRAIDTREYTRVGGTEAVRSDFRLLCATQQNLEASVRAGKLREDLYYRISVFQIDLPPLRARRGDVARLSHYFLTKHAQGMNKQVQGFTPEAMLALKSYEWPGNVRELENVIQRALVLSPGAMIEKEHLILHTYFGSPTSGKRLEDVERKHIEETLRETGWNISRSAGILDIDRVTLYHKIERYGLRRES